MKKIIPLLFLLIFTFIASVPFILAQTTTSGSSFVNPITPSTIEAVLTNIMSYLRTIAGTIAVIFIIIGGIMYMMSIGNKEMIERAKKTLIFAIAGLAIVVAAPLFYQEIKAIFGGGSPGSALQQVLANVLKLLLSIVGFLAIISMIIGSIWMFTAVGDDEKYKLGRKTATYSIIGLVIAVASLIIVNQVIALIGGSPSSSSSTSTPASATPTTTTYDLVGITGETEEYAYKGSDGNYYKLDYQKGMVSIEKNDVNPITMLGTLERTGNTVFRDHSGYYYETGSSGPIPYEWKEGDAVDYFPSKK